MKFESVMTMHVITGRISLGFSKQYFDFENGQSFDTSNGFVPVRPSGD